jgi:hypothetical protein
VKFQSRFVLSHVVAMKLKHPLEAPLIDVCSEAEARRLRCVRIAPRALSVDRNCGIRVNVGIATNEKIDRYFFHS